MSQYLYKGKKEEDHLIEGVVQADNLDDAVVRIMALGVVPLEVEKKKITKTFPNEGKVFFSFANRVPSGEVMIFIRQLSDLVEAGVPVLRSLEIIEQQTRHTMMKKVIHEITGTVKDGSSLSKALEQHSQVFLPLHVNLTRAGEISGQLDRVLARLAGFLEDDFAFRSQIRTSLLYPLFIVLVGLATIFVLLTWVIPQMTVILDDLGQKLPLITQVLISVSTFLARSWWVILSCLCLVIAYTKRISTTPEGRLWIDRLKLKIPLFSQFTKNAEISRFARTLSMLLENGVVIVTALESVALIMMNDVFKRELKRIAEDVAGGSSLTDTVSLSTIFPENVIRLIAIAEESGQMQKGLSKLALYYERQCKSFTKAVTSLIEPVLILLVGSCVGVMVMAMLLPLLQMDFMMH